MTGLHDVELDRESLAAELGALADRAELEESAAAAAAEAEAIAAEGHDPAAWRRASDFVVEVIAGQVCPAWALGEPEREQLSSALADVFDHYWPGGPNGVDHWHPLYRLAFAAGAVTLTCGMDWERGGLKPLRPKKETEDAGEAPERESPLLGGDDSLGEERGRFSIGG